MALNENATTAAQKRHFDDHIMEIAMGRLLQVGVLLASFVMLIGGVLYARAHHGETPNYRVYSSEPKPLRHFDGVIHGIKSGEPEAIIQLAVLLLIATPVARVAFALISFTIERDKLYVGVSLVVLAVLLFGFFHSQ